MLRRRDIPLSPLSVDGGIMQVSFLQSVDAVKKFALYITCLTESESKIVNVLKEQMGERWDGDNAVQ